MANSVEHPLLKHAADKEALDGPDSHRGVEHLGNALQLNAGDNNISVYGLLMSDKESLLLH